MWQRNFWKLHWEKKEMLRLGGEFDIMEYK